MIHQIIKCTMEQVIPGMLSTEVCKDDKVFDNNTETSTK